MNTPRDRFPQPPNFDYVRPEHRVPVELRGGPPLWLLLYVALGIFDLVLWALPDLAAWILP